MKRVRRPAALAGLLAAASLGLLLAALSSLFVPGADRYPDRPELLDLVLFLSALTAYPVVGALVAARRPDNPIGWLFLLVALFVSLGLASGEYVGHVLYGGHGLPAVATVAWIADWAWMVAFGLALPAAILLFPNGRFHSRRWRLIGGAIIVFGTIGTIAMALRPWNDAADYPFPNPFALTGPPSAIAETLATLFQPLVGIGLIVASLSLPLRYRHSTVDARQQLKWFGFSIAVLSVGIALTLAGAAVLPEEVWELSWYIVVVGIALIPVTVGIAILRYRLYDIDVVIRRTLVYGTVVGMLATVYVVLVLVLQAALSDLTGGETLPVALSTLAIAALFGPVRTRARAVVDRRFYRSRYDAQRTLEVFSGQLRDQIDLESVGETLVSVSRQAVEPTSAGLWLRRRGLA